MIHGASLHQRIQTVCLVIISVIAAGAALYWLKPVLVPFVLAVFFTVSLTPCIDVQIRYLRLPRWLAIVTTVLLGLAILVVLWFFVSASAGELTDKAGVYQTQIKQLLDKVVTILPLENFGLSSDDIAQSVLGIIPPNSVANLLSGTIGGVMMVLSNSLLVLIFMIFLMVGQRHHRATPGRLWSEVERRIKRYLVRMVLISGATGFFVGLTLTILGVEFGWIFGLLAFLLNFIPNIGSVIATLLPLPVAFLNPEMSFLAKILVLAVPITIQFTMGNIVAPKIMGESLDLHPVIILIALIFFGMIWGIVGMFLATPITAVIKILCERIEYCAPFAELLAGRLSAFSERFQRAAARAEDESE